MITFISGLLKIAFSASFVVLLVMFLRLILKKLPKWLICLMWIPVGLRLIIPRFPKASFGVIPDASKDVIYGTPINIGNIYQGNVSAITDNTAESIMLPYIIFGIWAVGFAAMLVYSAVSYIALYRKTSVSVHMEGRIFICDDIGTPFILGVVFPKIFIPSGIGDDVYGYVKAHEYRHIRRLDHIWKPIGFLLLSVYWFNPLLWLGYIMLCRDIELACDEGVISSMDDSEKALYSSALLSCSVKPKIISACPLSFGEVGVRERVKRVLNYRKPTFWIVIAAIVLCAAFTVIILVSPKDNDSRIDNTDDSQVEENDDVIVWFENPPWKDTLETKLDEYPDITLKCDAERLYIINGDTEKQFIYGMPIECVVFCDLSGDGKREICASVMFGSGICDSRIYIYDIAAEKLYELSDRMRHDYFLNVNDGKMTYEERLYDPYRYESGEITHIGTLEIKDGELVLHRFEERYPNDTTPNVPYTENADETYTYCDGRVYKYKLVLEGSMPNSSGFQRFTVLSNTEDFDFERVSKSIYSSQMDDLLDPDVAIIVDIERFYK